MVEDQSGSSPASQAFHVRDFLARHAYIIVVALLFGSAGMYYAHVFFPQLPTYKALIAGLGFGVFCTIVALGRRFI